VSNEELRGFRVGSTAELTHVITAADIDRFVELTGDTNPVHIDRSFAERTALRGTVAHGMLGASFISTIIGKHLPGSGSLWLTQTLEFLLPVRVGDCITVRAEVTDVNVAHRTLGLRTEVVNQHGQKVIDGQSVVKVLDVDPAPEPPSERVGPEVAIVTGASRGIGAAVARRLARAGYAVMINYRTDRDGADSVAGDIRSNGGAAFVIHADVTEPQAAEAMVRAAEEQFGRVTALVNNATGRIVPKTFASVTDEELDRYWNVHVRAPLALIRAALPRFERAGRGAVVNISSVYTNSTPPPQLLAYTATKAALESATRSLAVEYGPKGFRFNTVSPGMTDTQLIADTPEKTRLLTKMQTPLRKLAHPDDIAGGVCFLLSNEARHITGETLRICGGSVMM
jgi:3-oxoacyl-[acyl-carrier protein] reductase